MQNQVSNKSTLWGVILIALGAFFLLQVTGILGALSGLFWSVAFGVAGAIFLYVFLTGVHTNWWAAIPGFTFLGLAAMLFYDRFAPPFFAELGAAVFLAAIGTGFLAIFFTNREQWWALIPGGVLLSVAGVVTVGNSDIGFLNPASVLFFGIGCTFGLLGLMSSYLETDLRWAYIPAAIMLVLGTVIFTPFVGALNWVWPLALIAAGAYLVLRRHTALEAPMRNTGADFTAAEVTPPDAAAVKQAWTETEPAMAAQPGPVQEMEEPVAMR